MSLTEFAPVRQLLVPAASPGHGGLEPAGTLRTHLSARRLERRGGERSGRRLAGLSIGVLGPLSVTVDGREVVISGARRRDVLIRLALNEGRRLESGRLLESVWEGEAPAGAANSCRPTSAICVDSSAAVG